jgi:hypothetical protein
LLHHGAKLTGQRVTDALRVAPVDQIVLKRGGHAAAVEGFTQQQGTAVAGGALPITSTRTESLQEGVQGKWAFSHSGGALESVTCRSVLISHENTIRFILFQADLMNMPGLENSSFRTKSSK